MKLAGSSPKFYMANSPQALKGIRKRGHACAYDDQQGDSGVGTEIPLGFLSCAESTEHRFQ